MAIELTTEISFYPSSWRFVFRLLFIWLNSTLQYLANAEFDDHYRSGPWACAASTCCSSNTLTSLIMSMVLCLNLQLLKGILVPYGDFASTATFLSSYAVDLSSEQADFPIIVISLLRQDVMLCSRDKRALARARYLDWWNIAWSQVFPNNLSPLDFQKKILFSAV